MRGFLTLFAVVLALFGLAMLSMADAEAGGFRQQQFQADCHVQQFQQAQQARQFQQTRVVERVVERQVPVPVFVERSRNRGFFRQRQRFQRFDRGFQRGPNVQLGLINIGR